MKGLTKEEIEIVKSIDIKNVIRDHLRCEYNSPIECPFCEEGYLHTNIEDKTVTMCDECGWHGDSISFIMALKLASFVQAVHYLYVKYPCYSQAQKRHEKLIEEYKKMSDEEKENKDSEANKVMKAKIQRLIKHFKDNEGIDIIELEESKRDEGFVQMLKYNFDIDIKQLKD